MVSLYMVLFDFRPKDSKHHPQDAHKVKAVCNMGVLCLPLLNGLVEHTSVVFIGFTIESQCMTHNLRANKSGGYSLCVRAVDPRLTWRLCLV